MFCLLEDETRRSQLYATDRVIFSLTKCYKMHRFKRPSPHQTLTLKVLASLRSVGKNCPGLATLLD